MIHDLKPYPAYKDSGVPWIGKVPEHWEVKRLKRMVKFNPSKSEFASFLTSNIDATFLPMERVSVEGGIDTREIKPASDLLNGGFTYFRRGDVLIAKITPCFENGKGACLEALPTEIGFGSTEFIVSRPMPSVLPKFLYRITTLSEFRTLGADAMTGAAGQKRVPTTFVGNFQAAIPSLLEQQRIVHYLDHIDRRIRHYIRAKKKLIKLLEEQKQAIIHQAVTRGLDPNVKLKPSGIEWLGEIPEHWDLLRLKDAVFQIVDTEHKTAPFYENGNYLVVRTSNVKNGQLLFSDAKYTDEAGFKEWTKRGIPEPGDILFTREAPAGEACLVPEGLPLCLGQRMVLFRVNPEVLDPQFGLYSIYGGAAAEFIRQLSLGSTVPHFNMFDIACIPILLPPIDEQKKIASFLNHESKMISEAIDHAYQKISLLREYRTRLIADVVTGKLDVREAAANLPEETDETETLDDALAEDEELESNQVEDEQVGELEDEVLA